MKNSMILIILIFGASLNLKSQEVWSLQKCIEHALLNNLTVKQQIMQEQITEVDYKSAQANILPDLNFSASDNLNFGRSIDPFTNEFITNNSTSINLGLSSSVTVFSGLRNYNSTKRAELNLMATIENTQKIRNDISIALSNSYLQILFAEELLKNSQNQLQITQKQVERTKIMVDAGKFPQGNLFDVQAQLASEELQVISNENSLRTARLSLIQLLELDNNPNFQIERPEFGEIDSMSTISDINSIYNSAMSLPQIKSAEYYLESSQRSLSIAKGALSPSLTIGANYGTGFSSERKLYDEMMQPYDYPMVDQFSDNQSFSIYFRLLIPIFNKFSTAHSIKKAQINIYQSENQLEIEKQTLYKDIQSALNSALSAQAKYIGSKKALIALQESFKYTQQKFDLGLVNSLDYNTSKNNVVKAESDLLQAKYEFIFTKTILDFYMGNPITL